MSYRIIDAHAHVYKEKIAAKATENIGHFYGVAMSGAGTAEDLLQRLKDSGMEKAIIHSAATSPHQVQSINNFIHETACEHEEFIGFGTLHPDMENMREEIERMEQLGMKGIKLHPDFQEFNIDSPAAMRMYEMLEGRLIVVFHTGDNRHDFSAPRRLAKVLKTFPALKVIAAHFGGYSVWDDAERYLLGKELYIDTSSALDFITPQRAADMIRLHGSDKVLFGTDYPMWDHREELQRFMALPLTEKEREDILYNNAARLLNI